MKSENNKHDSAPSTPLYPRDVRVKSCFVKLVKIKYDARICGSIENYESLPKTMAKEKISSSIDYVGSNVDATSEMKQRPSLDSSINQEASSIEPTKNNLKRTPPTDSKTAIDGKKAAKPSLQCPHCPRLFPTNSRFKSHLTTHSSEKPFTCEICNNSYKASSTLAAHERHAHQVFKGLGRFKRQTLSNGQRDAHHDSSNGELSSTDDSASREHLQNRVPDGSVVMQCRLCSMTFTSKADYDRHLPVHTFESAFDRNPTTTSATFFVNSTEQPSAPKNFQCDTCLKRFNSSRGVKLHAYVHAKQTGNLEPIVPNNNAQPEPILQPGPKFEQDMPLVSPLANEGSPQAIRVVQRVLTDEFSGSSSTSDFGDIFASSLRTQDENIPLKDWSFHEFDNNRAFPVNNLVAPLREPNAGCENEPKWTGYSHSISLVNAKETAENIEHWSDEDASPKILKLT